MPSSVSSSSTNSTFTANTSPTSSISNSNNIVGSTSPQPSNRRNANSSPLSHSGKISPLPSNRMSPKNQPTQAQKSLFKSPDLPPPLLLQSPTGGSSQSVPPPPYSSSVSTSSTSSKPSLMQSISSTSTNNNNNRSGPMLPPQSGYSSPGISSTGISPWSSPNSSSVDKFNSNSMAIGSSSDHLTSAINDSKSQTCLSTSTPSSPAESSSPLSAESRNPPLIIPTDPIFDQQSHPPEQVTTKFKESIHDSTSKVDSSYTCDSVANVETSSMKTFQSLLSEKDNLASCESINSSMTSTDARLLISSDGPSTTT
ncbi:hypothetical protein BLA29_005317, partial [Euroglyphus maynei]